MKFLIVILFFVFESSVAAPHKVNVSPQRLREFPVVTLKEHRTTLIPEELATAKQTVRPDDRAISWAFRLRYLGKIQKIASLRQKLVDAVVERNPQLRGQYEYEILVSDGADEFWLPIQNKVLSPFKKEITQKGAPLYVHTRYFGSYFEGKAKPFFLMLGYRQPTSLFK